MKSLITGLLVFTTFAAVPAGATTIGSVTPVGSATAPRWGLYEAKFTIDADFDNPYDPEQIDVRAVIITPTGGEIEIPAFYYQGYDISLDPDANRENFAVPPGDEGPHWRFRFSPRKVGRYLYHISVTTPTDAPVQSDQYSFTAGVEVDDGFIRPDVRSPRTLRFDSGRPYIPIGMNIDWPKDDSGSYSLEWFYDRVSANGANWTRLWMTQFASGITIEWGASHTSGLYDGLGVYSQEASARLDRIFDLWKERGIYGQVVLNIHSQYEVTKWSSWDGAPLNAANGGPLESSAELWESAEANRLIRNRTRYMIARWGYHSNILLWEIFNEVDGIAGWDPKLAHPWHHEMEQFITELDPTDRIVTTSYGISPDINRDQDWDYPGFDLVELHLYNKDPIKKIPEMAEILLPLQKPIIFGEYGIDWEENLNAEDPSGIHLRNGAWLPLMTGFAGTGMTWWWYSYIYDLDLFGYLKPVAAFFADEDLADYETVGLKYYLENKGLTLYGLRSANRVIGWIHDEASVWSNDPENLVDHQGEEIKIFRLSPGNYHFTFWDTQNDGGIYYEETVAVGDDGAAVLSLPSFKGDTAIKVEQIYRKGKPFNKIDNSFTGCAATPGAASGLGAFAVLLLLAAVFSRRRSRSRRV